MTPGEFIGALLCAAPHAHKLHLATDSYSVHQAMGSLYEGLPGAVDTLSEVVQGLEGKLDITMPDEPFADEPEEFLSGLLDVIEESREALSDHTAVQNLVDEVVALVAQAKYRVENLG